MIRKLLFFLLLIFATAFHLNAQEESKLADCRKIVVEDSDRRGFDELESYTLDVGGDGKPDKITPRTYAVKTKRKVSNKFKAGEVHWIAFDLKAGNGRVIKSFFKYNYGTEEAVYWVYALIPCRFNSDARIDLLFYSGDDTSDETIILENKGNSFRVRSKKTDEYE
jgi:hypothetical protein